MPNHSLTVTYIFQVKEALQYILTELNQGDTFNIIRFSSITHKLGTMRYTGTAVRKARKYINSLEVEGGTNIDGGLKVCSDFLIHIY